MWRKSLVCYGNCVHCVCVMYEVDNLRLYHCYHLPHIQFLTYRTLNVPHGYCGCVCVFRPVQLINSLHVEQMSTDHTVQSVNTMPCLCDMVTGPPCVVRVSWTKIHEAKMKLICHLFWLVWMTSCLAFLSLSDSRKLLHRFKTENVICSYSSWANNRRLLYFSRVSLLMFSFSLADSVLSLCSVSLCFCFLLPSRSVS